MPTVNFIGFSKSVKVPNGITLNDAALLAGVVIDSHCGGRGTCGKCKVQIVRGNEPKYTFDDSKFISGEEKEQGFVLGCKYLIFTDIDVVVPKKTEKHRKVDLPFINDHVKLDPAIKKEYFHLPNATVHDQRGDYERIVSGLEIACQNPSLELLRKIPDIVRINSFKITAIMRDEELLDIEPGNTVDKMYGLVFDIGTTTVVGFLVDLSNGDIIGAKAITNPQNIYGADVISRITHVIEHGNDGLMQLNKLVIDGMNQIIRDLIEKSEIESDCIYDCTVVGNTTMSHLFLGVNPKSLAPSPFIPAYTGMVQVYGAEIGLLLNPLVKVSMLPNIAGYVGSDTTAVMLATHIDTLDGYTLIIDIGTNGELVLAGNDRILTCSTAAGPAFEGAHIKHGMRAYDGAIEEVVIDDVTGMVEVKTIGDKEAIGICGSGILDAIAQLYKVGLINQMGAVVLDAPVHPKLLDRIALSDTGYEFQLADDITICQKDIRELQLGKGAIYAGIMLLLKEMGITTDEVSRMLIAGAFGSYIKKESALAIGLFPKLSNGVIQFIGNAASEGAKLCLINKDELDKCQELASKAEYVELSTNKQFQDEFVSALYFPANKGV